MNIKIPKKRSIWLAALTAGLGLISFDLRAELSITEFLARSTNESLQDEDEVASDWIEIHNSGNATVSTDGYFLTDNAGDLTKWQLPAIDIPAGGYLMVFASGKDRAVAGSELHSNFSLSGGGEFLALVDPDGATLVSSFSPEFPEQYDNISYGVGTGGALTQEEFITEDSTVAFFPPTAPLPDWETAGFNDSAWTLAFNGVGWGYPNLPGGANGSTFEAEARLARNSSVRGTTYLRYSFEVEEAAEVVNMTMEVLYEDGYVIFLNGTEVASSNAPASPAFNSVTGISIEENNGPDFVPIEFAGHLVDGTNVLAVQAMNNSGGSSDFYFRALLDAEVQDLSLPPQLGFFQETTPGAPNGLLSAGPPERVTFSEGTKAFTDTFTLALSTETPGALIRFTLDGSLPTDEAPNPSPLYSSPFFIDTTTQVRAAAFLPGALAAETRTEGYFKLTPDAASFTSDLPIVLIDSFGRGAPFDTGSTDRRPMMMAVWEPKGEINPRSSMINPPDLVNRIAARKRGSSSGSWPKYNMSIEGWTENDWEEDSFSPLGMAGDDDWILSSRYQFDRALMRNTLIYQLSRDIDRFAARSKYVELFNNVNGGEIQFNAARGTEYFGIYEFMEKLDRSADRIDVERMDRSVTAEPEISGGYIIKNDRSDPGEPTLPVQWGNGGSDSLVHIYPDGGPNSRRPNDFFITPTQKTWLQNHMNEIGVAVSATNGVNPSTGIHFTEYVDVASFIDHMWLNALMMNVDWGRLSGWMYKPRNGPLVGGPVWDFDRSAGSEDSRDNNPIGWNPSGDSRVWYDGQFPWYGKVLGFHSVTDNPSSQLSTRPDQFQQAVDRWFELRKEGREFSTAHIDATIDSFADEIREAQARNFIRWSERNANGGQFSGGLSGWEGEVAHLKGWLDARTNWIDGQFFQPPTFNNNGGVVPEGFELSMNSIEAAIYYTLDGSDPRAPGGGIAVGAVPFDGGPIDSVVLLEDASCQYFVPVDDSLEATWFLPSFVDDGWSTGTSGLGFESFNGALTPEITTDIKAQMQPSGSPNNASCYFRYEFDFDNADSINSIALEIKSDDGFVAYLNGVEVARSSNVPATIEWNSDSTSGASDNSIAAYTFNGIVDNSSFDYNISAFKDSVVNGTNVLAIQGMNGTSGGSDFLMKPRVNINHTVVASPITLNGSASVVARVHDGQEWSAPASASFVVGADLADVTNLVISEIMYNPVGPTLDEMNAGFVDGDQFEYLELLNISTNPIDLGDVSFTGGVTFSFFGSAVTSLEPGARVLVVKEQEAFEQRYGNGFSTLIAGVFEEDTGLNNGGESLTLEGADGVIRGFEYNDKFPWPESADGDGPSMVLVAPGSNPDHAVGSNWRASVGSLGSVGGGDSVAFVGNPDADGDQDGMSAFAEYAFGTSDSDPSSGVLVAGLSPAGILTVTFPRNLAADEAIISIELSTDLATWVPAGDMLPLDLEVHNGDGTVTYSAETPDPIAGGELFVRLRVSSR